MQITIDTATPLTETDKGVLAALLGATNIEALAAALATVKPAPEPAKAPSLPKVAKEGVGQKLQREAAEREQAAKEEREVVPVEEPEPQPKKTTPRKPRPAKTEPVEEPAAPRPVEDDAPATPSPVAAVAVTDEDDKAVVGEAIARATKLQADGKGARIKEVLASLGAKRVSLMTAAQARQFLTELDD